MNKIDKLKDIIMSFDIDSHRDELFDIIPELKAEVGFCQKNEWHDLDVWNHTLKAVSVCDNCFDDRLILLLHDIGKPFSYQDDGNVRHFHGHSEKSSEMAATILNRIGFDRSKIEELCLLIIMHSTPININDVNINNLSFYNRLLKIQQCDAYAYEDKHALDKLVELKNTKDELNKIFENFKTKFLKR